MDPTLQQMPGQQGMAGQGNPLENMLMLRALQGGGGGGMGAPAPGGQMPAPAPMPAAGMAGPPPGGMPMPTPPVDPAVMAGGMGSPMPSSQGAMPGMGGITPDSRMLSGLMGPIPGGGQ